MKSRDRFIALIIACVVVVAAIAALEWLLPSQGYQSEEGKDYGYVYSGPKSSSFEFTSTSMPDDSILMFGSSELSTPPSLVPQVPAVTFGTHMYGVNTTSIGEAFDQDLWQAIAAGAYAPHVENKKVVLLISPSWFFDGGVDNSIFEARFSYNLLREFCHNDAISSQTKQQLGKRLVEQGISQSVVDAAMGANPITFIDDFFMRAVDDLRLRNELKSVREKGFVHETGNSQAPDFDSLRKQAVKDGEKHCSTNGWNFDDASWEENVGSRQTELYGALSYETFSDTPEYDDFDLFLTVCDEAGLEPLVIITPLNGDYYDWTGVNAQTRAACYDRIRSIAFSHRVQVADFSEDEYTPYFLHDQVHFGWVGWTDVEEAIYKFVVKS